MRKFVRLGLFLAIGLLVSIRTLTAQTAEVSCAFTNPILTPGQDPSAVYHDGFYYLLQTDGLNLDLRKSAQLTELGNVQPVRIFTLPQNTAYSQELWGPELVFARGGWFIYFAADDGTNANHRLYALQADSDDPLGAWTFKGKIYSDAATDKWAIDPAVFEYNGQGYMVWAGWPGDTGDFPQNLYIAPMSDPLTVAPRRQISTPDQPWEHTVAAINEGPEPFIHDGHLSIVYSADASWTAAYKLGLLALTGTDPLDAKAWTKSGPVFQQVRNSQDSIYGPGHSAMPLPSPDGMQDWLLYHVKRTARNGWADREIHAQPFTWDANGLPVFGTPTLATVGIPLPSGQPCGELARYPLDGNVEPNEESSPTGKLVGAPIWTEGRYGQALQLDGQQSYVDLNAPLLNTMGSFSVAAWASLDQTDHTMIFVSQDGGTASNFALQYSAEAGKKLAFTLFALDGTVAVQALSTFTPEAHRWYQLTGVRDALSQQIRLYVEGKLEATVAYAGGWNARGHTLLGAAKLKGQRGQFLAGKLDDFVIFDGAISDAMAALLATRESSP